MNLETIELHKSKSTEPHTPDNLSFTKDSIADASIDTNKIVNVKLNEVMNYILQNSYGVNDYSTNELNRIIIFSGYNKVKCMGLIEEMTKEELMGLVEKWDADQEKSALARLKVEDEGSKVKKKKVKTKEIIVSNLQNSSDKLEEKISHEKCWEFIHYSPNIVDIKDLLLNHDHLKMLREAKKIKNKDNKQINDFFDTFFQNRLKKIKELITRSVNIDDNDFHFLSTCDHGLDIKNRVFKGIPTINYNAFNIKIQIPNDADKLEQNMNRLPDGLKSYLLKYLDIFSIGKLGLANKSFHNLVYKNFDLESLARSNCIAIFKNSQLYENNKRSLENTFSNYLDMLCYR